MKVYDGKLNTVRQTRLHCSTLRKTLTRWKLAMTKFMCDKKVFINILKRNSYYYKLSFLKIENPFKVSISIL